MTRNQYPDNLIHMENNFDPAAYEYVGSFDTAAPDVANGVRAILYNLLDDSPTSRFGKTRGHQCDHCGAHIRYVAVLRHTPTGDHIASGEQCLDNRFSLASKADFDAMRKASAEERAEMKTRTRREEFLAANPDLLPILWTEDENGVPACWKGTYAYGVLCDMHRKLRRDGTLTDRQIAYARKLAAEADEKLADNIRRVAERATAADAPLEGRCTVTGTVVARKPYENQYTSGYKLTVKTTEGWLAWITEPQAVTTGIGDQVTFSAKFKRSDRDPKFAFGSRPTQFAISEFAFEQGTTQ